MTPGARLAEQSLIWDIYSLTPRLQALSNNLVVLGMAFPADSVRLVAERLDSIARALAETEPATS